MAKELRRIPFDEFAANLARVFEDILRENEIIVIEKEGTGLVLLKPLRLTKTRREGRTARLPRARTVARSKEGIPKAAGSWKDKDYSPVSAIPKSKRLKEKLLSLAGVWSGLDTDHMIEDLYKARHEAPPSAPINL